MKFQRIDPVFHRDIKNRRLQVQSINDHRRLIGINGGTVVGEKELIEIADLEDACIVKMRELTEENRARQNRLLNEQSEKY